MPLPFDRLFKQHRIDSRILAVFLLLAAASFAFVKLASEVMEGDTLAFDRWLLQGLRNTSNPSVPAGPGWLQEVMIDVTALGGVSVLTIITVLAAGYLLAVRKVTTAAFLTAAIAGGALLSTLLKFGFARARPDLVAHLVEVDTASFPSGHAMNSAITYLTLGALLARAENDRPVRIYLLAVAIALTLLIGFSRVYLGVHWPSDVMAGWCVGAAWAVLCSLAARRLQRRDKIEPPGEMHSQ
ncbi:MAG TPA: phosphatase PAP2 family protein [Allosphingosinicella sp.]|jgi:undecaprenyl-diphosphatase